MSDDLVDEICSVLTDVVEKGPAGVGESRRPTPRPGCWDWPLRPTTAGGMGLAELAVLVRGAGARSLDLPFRETLVCGLRSAVCGLLTLARSGTPEQQETFIPGILTGDLLVAPTRAARRSSYSSTRGATASRTR